MSKDSGRKRIICERCSKDKLHFGLNMCSACLRKSKRETKPSFYLGTCYSEMSRRVKTFDPKRPKYFGKQICTKEEFIRRFLTDDSFLTQYLKWQQSGFKRISAPSVDRIDNEGDYVIDNLQFLSQGENSKKDTMKPLKDNKGNYFRELKEVAEFHNTNKSTICIQIKNNKTNRKGIYYEYITLEEYLKRTTND